MRRRISAAVTRYSTQFLTAVGLLGLALIAFGAYLASWHPYGEAHWTSATSIAVETVGGALLAAVLVGYLVDQITRHKLSRETGEQWLWALLGEDTPPELRERAKDVISHGQAHLSVDFQCAVDWVGVEPEQQSLRLRIHVITDGINHSRSEHYLPRGAAWAMPSVQGHQTRYLKWIFEAFDQAGARAPRRLEANEGLIAAHSHSTPPAAHDYAPDGSVFLYHDELIEQIRKKDNLEDECAALPGERFRMERDVEVVLDPTDFFPFYIVVPTVKLNFKFYGDACQELAIKARAGGAVMRGRGGGTESVEICPDGALLPGNVVIFSWHPRDPRRKERSEEVETPDDAHPSEPDEDERRTLTRS
jgi:hypothetical protein